MAVLQNENKWLITSGSCLITLGCYHWKLPLGWRSGHDETGCRVPGRPKTCWLSVMNKYVWDEYRWKAQCLFMELSPKLGMCVRTLAQGTDVSKWTPQPGIHGGLLLVGPKFQDFAECFVPMQTFSIYITGVASHSLGGGAVYHNAAASAVMFRCWWGRRAEWGLGRRWEGVAHRTGHCSRKKTRPGIPPI